MKYLPRSTLWSGAVGALVGVALGFVPLVMLVAPVFAGGVAGVLERGGPRRGAVAGAIAGVLLAVLGALVSWSFAYVRFGAFPFFAGEVSLPSMAFAALLSVLAATGGVVVAAIGGALGGLLVDNWDEAPGGDVGEPASRDGVDRKRQAVAAIVALAAGILVFAVVALALTAALDPYIWPSALVGLPIGFVAGAVVAVLGYVSLVRERADTRAF